MKDLNECTYCGSQDQIEKDHVPPRCLFAFPRPNNLITVPSCRECNSSFGLDDDYFSKVTLVRSDVAVHPRAAALNQKIAGSIGRISSYKYRDYLESQVETVDLISPNNLYIGQTRFMHVDHRRISRVTRRIVRGLFFHENKTRFSDETHYISVVNAEQISVLEQKLPRIRIRSLAEGLIATPPKTIGDNEFSFRFRRARNDFNSSVWFFSFYGGSPFFAVTYPKNIHAAVEVF